MNRISFSSSTLRPVVPVLQYNGFLCVVHMATGECNQFQFPNAVRLGELESNFTCVDCEIDFFVSVLLC